MAEQSEKEKQKQKQVHQVAEKKKQGIDDKKKDEDAKMPNAPQLTPAQAQAQA